MEILQPLAVAHVRLSARNILHMPCVDQAYLEPALLEQLEERNPVHPGRLHRYRLDPTLLQPVGRRPQILTKRGKSPHRLGIAFRRHSHINLRCSHIDPRRVAFEHRRRRQHLWLCLLPSLPMATLLMPSRTARTVHKRVLSQTGSAATQKATAVTTDLSTSPGTTLVNGLLKRRHQCFVRPTCRQNGLNQHIHKTPPGPSRLDLRQRRSFACQAPVSMIFRVSRCTHWENKAREHVQVGGSELI